jgi:hypothetical protein
VDQPALHTRSLTQTKADHGLGHTRRNVLSASNYIMDEIHSSIKRLKPEKRDPIPEAPNAEPLDFD